MVMFYELAEKALELERNGRELIRLNVGDTNLPTPKCAVEAAVNILKTMKSGYGSSAGMPELREKIAEREGCEVENVVIGSGSKSLLYGLLSILGKKNVVIPSPYWPAYGLICKQLGLDLKIIKTEGKNGWNFEPPELDKQDIIVICNPLNPTSTIYSDELIRKVAENANGATVILDEAYRGIAFREIPKTGGAIRLRSFSKEFNMEGWRLGYAIAPKEIAKKLIAFNQITSTCTPLFVQAAGLACLENEKEILEANRKIWGSRSKIAQAAFRKAGFNFAEPEAGIYIFATHPKIKDAGEFALRLLDEGVVVAPGGDFGYKNFFRLCINQDEKKLIEAIEKMI